MFREIDKAKDKLYQESEARFVERLEVREWKHAEALQVSEQKIRAEYQVGEEVNAKQ